MPDLKKIADEADIIVNGIAFTKSPKGVRVINLNHPDDAMVLDFDGTVLETSMNDIEMQIVKEYFARNKKYMEA